MKGFILAAGEGIRLRPLTNFFPKPLLLVLNKPLLWYAETELKKVGVKIIAANIFYKKDLLRIYLIQEKIFISEEESLLGTAGGIGAAGKYLFAQPICDNIIIYNSDIISNIDLNILVQEHLKNGATVTMALYDYDKVNSVCIDNDFNVLKFDKERHISDKFKYYTYSGISIIKREFAEKFPVNQYGDLIKYLEEEINNRRGSVKGILFDNKKYFWFDCGTIEKYFEANKYMFENFNDYDKMEFIKKENLFTYKTNQFSENTEFKGFNIIGKNVVIDDDVHLKNTIVHNNAKIHKGLQLENAIVGDGFIFSI